MQTAAKVTSPICALERGCETRLYRLFGREVCRDLESAHLTRIEVIAKGVVDLPHWEFDLFERCRFIISVRQMQKRFSCYVPYTLLRFSSSQPTRIISTPLIPSMIALIKVRVNLAVLLWYLLYARKGLLRLGMADTLHIKL